MSVDWQVIVRSDRRSASTSAQDESTYLILTGPIHHPLPALAGSTQTPQNSTPPWIEELSLTMTSAMLPELDTVDTRETSSLLPEAVSVQFRDRTEWTLRDVQVTEEAGYVVLNGRVPTFYLKQLAQTIAGSVDGVNLLRNDIVVTQRPDRTRPR